MQNVQVTERENLDSYLSNIFFKNLIQTKYSSWADPEGRTGGLDPPLENYKWLQVS